MKLLKSVGFRKRFRVAIGIIVVIAAGILTPNCIGLRGVYCAAAMLAVFEVFTMAVNPTDGSRSLGKFLSVAICPLVAVSLLLASALLAAFSKPEQLVLAILVAIISDAAGYLVGKLIGGRFVKWKPFPRISPGKTVEGYLGAALITIPLYYAGRGFWLECFGYALSPWVILASLVAIIGDLYESWLKRLFGVKDANDVLRTIPGFRIVEDLLGGKDGHGGYFDRLDSIHFVIIYFFLSGMVQGRI